MSRSWKRALPGACPSRGDANDDGAIDIADPIFLLSYLYGKGPQPVSLVSGDANRDEAVDTADVIYTLSWLYGAGPPIEP